MAAKKLNFTVFRRLLPVLVLGGVYLAGFGAKQLLSSYVQGIVIYICINSILAMSLNLISGYTGQFALGHAGFMAVGAYTSAILMMKAHWPFLPAFLMAGVLAAILGIFVGFPTLRLKADYLAIATLGLNQIVLIVLYNMETLAGGARGLVGVPLKTNLPLALVVFTATIFIFHRMIHSKFGRSFIAIREDEIGASSIGMNTTYYKILSFTVGSFFAGLAGALMGHYMMYLNPDIFNYNKSVEILTMVILGGLASLPGSILGATVITLIPEVFRNLATLVGGFGLENLSRLLREGWMLIYALLLVVMMLIRPQGLLGGKEFSLSMLLPISGPYRKTQREGM